MRYTTWQLLAFAYYNEVSGSTFFMIEDSCPEVVRHNRFDFNLLQRVQLHGRHCLRPRLKGRKNGRAHRDDMRGVSDDRLLSEQTFDRVLNRWHAAGVADHDDLSDVGGVYVSIISFAMRAKRGLAGHFCLSYQMAYALFEFQTSYFQGDRP